MALTLGITATSTRLVSTGGDTFDFTFPIRQTTDVDVYVDGDIVNTNAYIVTGEGQQAGGRVTFGFSRPSGEVITIVLSSPPELSESFSLTGTFNLDTLNRRVEKIYLSVISVWNTLFKRTFRLSDASSVDIPALPIPSHETPHIQATFDSSDVFTGLEWTAIRTGAADDHQHDLNFLERVSVENTITGDGTSGSPLAVANPFTQAEKDKLSSIAPSATVGATSGQASAISANTAKEGITTAQKNAIVANTAKRSYPQEDQTKLAGIQDNVTSLINEHFTLDNQLLTESNDEYISPIFQIDPHHDDARELFEYTFGIQVTALVSLPPGSLAGNTSSYRFVIQSASNSNFNPKTNNPSHYLTATTTEEEQIHVVRIPHIHTHFRLVLEWQSGTQGVLFTEIKLVSYPVSDRFTSLDELKLDGIETGAQVNVKPDWTAPAGADDEILNKPTIPIDTTLWKGVYSSSTQYSPGDIVIYNSQIYISHAGVVGIVPTDASRWARIQSITAAEVKTLYEGNPDTNAFTNALLTKLNGIASGATVGMTADQATAFGTLQGQVESLEDDVGTIPTGTPSDSDVEASAADQPTVPIGYNIGTSQIEVKSRQRFRDLRTAVAGVNGTYRGFYYDSPGNVVWGSTSDRHFDYHLIAGSSGTASIRALVVNTTDNRISLYFPLSNERHAISVDGTERIRIFYGGTSFVTPQLNAAYHVTLAATSLHSTQTTVLYGWRFPATTVSTAFKDYLAANTNAEFSWEFDRSDNAGGILTHAVGASSANPVGMKVYALHGQTTRFQRRTFTDFGTVEREDTLAFGLGPVVQQSGQDFEVAVSSTHADVDAAFTSALNTTNGIYELQGRFDFLPTLRLEGQAESTGAISMGLYKIRAGATDDFLFAEEIGTYNSHLHLSQTLAHITTGKMRGISLDLDGHYYILCGTGQGYESSDRINGELVLRKY